MLRSDYVRHWAPSGILILSLGGVYLVTLAPGLTWANNGADGGDLVTAAATGGIPHPSGYPTYLLLARLFQFLPFGSLAYRTNLFSAVCTVSAAVLVYYLVIGLPYAPLRGNWLAGIISAYAFGLSPMVWSQAVISEVYGLHALFLVLTLYLLPLGVDPPPAWRTRLDRISGLIFGLGLGNHLTFVFLLPPMLLTGVISKAANRGGESSAQHLLGQKRISWRGWSFRWESFTTRAVWMTLGLLIYLILPLRAAANPPINWGDPITLKNLIWLVSGRMYGNYAFGVPTVFILPRLQAWAGLFVVQFGILGLLLGLFGLFYCRPLATRIYLVTGWMVIAYSVFSIGYNSYDAEIYLIPVFLSVALWIGLGGAGLMEFLSRRARWVLPAAGILFIGYFIGFAALNFPKVDASQDREAETYGKAILAAAPAQALVFTGEDESTFTLWYFQFVLHERPDMAVLDTRLLSYNWYRNMLRSAYPSLHVPEHQGVTTPYEFVAVNTTRPVCEASFSGSTVVDCQ
jgi:hypothetical protein